MKGYVSGILHDARDYGNHAGRANINMEDVRMAVRQSQEAFSSISPSREVKVTPYTVVSSLRSRLDLTSDPSTSWIV
ncbi:unnamed protein product [Choristocarpus tenellus]